MEIKRLLRLLSLISLLVCNVSCDQISKSIVRSRVDYNEQISLIHPYLTLTKIENSGAFLSIGDSLPYPIKLIFLSLLPAFALGYGLFFLFWKANLSRNLSLALCFIIGGGIGNMYDRMVHGSVTDFLHVDFGFVQTGIFNMADVSIMVGMALFVVNINSKKEAEGTNPLP